MTCFPSDQLGLSQRLSAHLHAVGTVTAYNAIRKSPGAGSSHRVTMKSHRNSPWSSAAPGSPWRGQDWTLSQLDTQGGPTAQTPLIRQARLHARRPETAPSPRAESGQPVARLAAPPAGSVQKGGLPVCPRGQGWLWRCTVSNGAGPAKWANQHPPSSRTSVGHQLQAWSTCPQQ